MKQRTHDRPGTDAPAKTPVEPGRVRSRPIALALAIALVMTVVTVIAPAPPADAAPAGAFRALDTRTHANKPGAKAKPCFVVRGRGGVPGNAAAVAINLTVIDAVSGGYATAYPKGASRPGTSTINYSARVDTNNSGIVKVGSGGQICVYTHRAAHLVVDVTGSFTSAQFAGVSDFRPYDSRRDGSKQKLPSKGENCEKVTGTRGIPANAHAVAVNATVTQPDGNGFFTLYPKGAGNPGTANLNYVRGQTIGNSAIVKVGTGGEICLYTRTRAHAILDVTGYFAPGTNVVARSQPKRVYDSRDDGRLAANRPRCFSVASAAPSSAKAVFVNLAIVGAANNGHATLHPHGSTKTITRSVHFRKGVNRSAGQMVPVASNRRICVTPSQAVDIVVDVQGYDNNGNRISLTPAQVAIDFGLSQVGTVYVGCSAGNYRFGEKIPTRTLRHTPQSWCDGQTQTHIQPAGQIEVEGSGLVWRMFKEAGIDLPYKGSATMKQIPLVPGVGQVGLNDQHRLKPGDLLVKKGHVGMYIGNGRVIESAAGGTLNPDGSRVGTRVVDLAGFISGKSYTAHRWPGFF